MQQRYASEEGRGDRAEAQQGAAKKRGGVEFTESHPNFSQKIGGLVYNSAPKKWSILKWSKMDISPIEKWEILVGLIESTSPQWRSAQSTPTLWVGNAEAVDLLNNLLEAPKGHPRISHGCHRCKAPYSQAKGRPSMLLGCILSSREGPGWNGHPWARQVTRCDALNSRWLSILHLNVDQCWINEHPKKDALFMVGICTRGARFWPTTVLQGLCPAFKVKSERWNQLDQTDLSLNLEPYSIPWQRSS